MSYDIIGDIHGHADKLESLLAKLGYRNRNGCWRHPSGGRRYFWATSSTVARRSFKPSTSLAEW